MALRLKPSRSVAVTGPVANQDMTGEKSPPEKYVQPNMATKQLAILVRSAVDINDALRAISDQVEYEELRSIYIRIRELISEGKSLSEAHGQFPKVFSSIYVNMLGAAEKSGALPLVLQRLSDFIFYQIEIKRKVVGALTYPAMMIVMAILVVFFLFVKVMPGLTKSFLSLKVVLPWYSIWMNNISAWMIHWWFLSLCVVVLTVIGIMAWSKTKSGIQKLDAILFKLPVVGILIQKVALSRFSKTLSTILASTNKHYLWLKQVKSG